MAGASNTSFVVVLVTSLFLGTGGSWGVARSDNFIVNAESREEAQAVLFQAEQLRKDIATEWLGDELPCGSGATIIHVRPLTGKMPARGQGAFWRKTGARQHHLVWIYRDNTFDETLEHELTHVVLETANPGFPEWAHEGIASMADKSDYAGERAKIYELLTTMSKPEVIAEVMKNVGSKDR